MNHYNLSLSSTSIDNKESLNKYLETTKLDNITNYTVLRQIGFEYENIKYNPQYEKFLKIKSTNDTHYINIYSLGDEQYKKYLNKLGLNYDEISTKAILMDYLTVGYKKSDETKMVYKTMRETAYQKNDVLTGILNDNQNYQIEIGYITNVKPFGLKNYQETYLIVSEELFNQILQDL